MDDKQLDAMKFAINEKANQASILMNSDNENVNFHRGQYQAYVEIYSMLNNIYS